MDIKITITAGTIVVVLLAAIILVAISLEKLNSDEVGLKYDTVSKKLDTKPTYEGLHSGPPGFTFVKFPSVFSNLNFGYVQCLNRDGVQIRLSISFQYRVRPNDLHLIVVQFRDHEKFVDILRAIGESAIHDACSKFNTSQFQAERGAFQEEVRNRLVKKYDDVKSDVTDLQVNDILRPREYESAVKSKESAREDIEVAINERPQRLTEAETAKLQAKTHATITVDKAMSEARIAETKASSEATGILNDYTKEAESYRSLMDSIGMDTAGFLAYMGVRVIDEAKNPVYIGLKGPAKTSWLGVQ